RTEAITPAAIKSSSGPWVHLKIARCGKGARAMEDLKQAGYWSAALAPGGARRARDRQEECRLRGADPDVRKSRITERLGGRGGCAVRNRAPPRRGGNCGRKAQLIGAASDFDQWR